MSRTRLIGLHAAVILLAVLSSAPNAFAQSTADTPSYFPLSVGNSWSYITFVDPPDAPADTLGAGTFEVSSRVAIADTLYYVADYPFALADTLRATENGTIRGRVDGEDVLLFDFTLEEGETYTFRRGELVYDVTAAHRENVEVSAGSFEDVLVLSFDAPGWVDEEVYYTFAQGTGIVEAIGDIGSYAQLHESTVYPLVDTLDWHGYFPLEVGARWQYGFLDVESVEIQHKWMEDWLVARDTLISGERYAVIEGRCKWMSDTSDPKAPQCAPETVQERFVRYDEEAANLVELHDDEPPTERFFLGHDYALDGPFHTSDSGDKGAGRSYTLYRPSDTLTIEGVAVDVPLKGVHVHGDSPAGATFAHGIGLVYRYNSVGTPGWYQSLWHAEVGGKTYGSYRPVASERPVDAAAEARVSVYPNPAATKVTVEFTLPEPVSAALEVYDALGRRVFQTSQTPMPAGRHTTRLSLNRLAAGLYAVVLVADGTAAASTSIVVAR